LLETPLEELYLDFFRDLYPEIHAIEPLALACDCSTERMERVLISLGRAALEEMIADHHNTEISCNFCAKKHTFSETALTKLLAEAFEP
ncbi:MAG: Hsp33 family molecular chaperone HslO, partial [Clostridia bacterium]|nr:Hsp33 family molecular chaperone HslO [Clostridia bacterium]